jgi:hypothetical protein
MVTHLNVSLVSGKLIWQLAVSGSAMGQAALLLTGMVVLFTGSTFGA